jgi:hypothetical protein
MAEELMVEAVIWDFGGVLHVITANAGCLPLSSGDQRRQAFCVRAATE